MIYVQASVLNEFSPSCFRDFSLSFNLISIIQFNLIQSINILGVTKE